MIALVSALVFIVQGLDINTLTYRSDPYVLSVGIVTKLCDRDMRPFPVSLTLYDRIWN